MNGMRNWRMAAGLTALVLVAGAAAAGMGGAAAPKAGGASKADEVKPALPQFTLFVYESQEQLALRGDKEKGAAYWGEFAEYGKVLAEAGALVSGSATEPPEAGRVITVKGKQTVTAAVAVAEGQHRLGGYFVIQAKDLAAATEWAAKCPSARTGHVEVRPNIPMNAPQMRDPVKK
jgi:hypothetical protein